jgi:hypothetical protein
VRKTDHLEDPGEDGRTILRWVFRKWDVRVMDWKDVAQDRHVVGICECGSDQSGSTKCWEFSD